MVEYYFSVNLDESRKLCLAPLTSNRIECADIEITDESGHFLFEQEGEGEYADIKILAHVISEDGVLGLREYFGMQ